MFIDTLKNMPVGLKFVRLDGCGQYLWSGEIICEDGEKKLVLMDVKDSTASLDKIYDDKIEINITNEGYLRLLGYNLKDIERLGKKDYHYNIGSLLCKNVLNLPVKTKFKYVDCDDVIEIVYVDGIKKLWNNTCNHEERAIHNSRIEVINYEKLYLYGYSRKAIEYLCTSLKVIKVVTFDKISKNAKFFGRYKRLEVKDLTIEDRILMAEDLLKSDEVNYDEQYNRFIWEKLGNTFSYYATYARISLVSTRVPWTISKDNNGFECIKYFEDFDESLRYINLQ